MRIEILADVTDGTLAGKGQKRHNPYTDDDSDSDASE